jgi:hypothetical protein
MPLPTMDQYATAVKNYHRICLQADRELAQGQVALDDTGKYPQVAAGAFAIVFKLTCGPRRYAVRCFTREVGQVGQRYEHIRNALAALPPACGRHFAGFEWFPGGQPRRGFLHGSEWFPFLKMEWIEGTQLKPHVLGLVQRRDTAALARLADDWERAILALKDARLAHGDLQPANVLVDTTGTIRFIDYDTMFVPAMRGWSSVAIGVPGYQHPGRSLAHFDEHLDDFAAAAILLSLRALAHDPTWLDRARAAQRRRGNTGLGEEELLLAAADYAAPDRSPVLQGLIQSSDSTVARLAEALATSR